MKDLTTAQEELENTQGSTVEKMILYGEFEGISRETNQMLKQVGETIRELKSKGDEDRHSIRSSRSNRSVTTRKSRGSKSHCSSLASTSSSARSRRLDLEEEIATFRVKMNLIHEKEIDKSNRYALDEIEQRRLELRNEEKRLLDEVKILKEKFKIKEQLAEKEARVEACVRFENENTSIVFDDGDQGSYVQEHVKRFLASQEELSAPPRRENSETPAPDVTAHETCQPTPPHVPGLDSSAPVYIPKSPATSIPVQQQESVIPTVYTNEDSAPAPSTNQIMNSRSITTDPNLVQSQLSEIAKLLEVQSQKPITFPRARNLQWQSSAVTRYG